ncbi:choline transporter-like 2 isoform X2 [Neocloeon triangulifer]|uniref:choline transporter-like 2 isoform X2 n=1 Tax=Neocloeon triangulifer TaxID=2078957 RepID=UPI00286ED413|nr:choline transporter-like 2 isoform X2 [Neocloeon triangulifer]
MGSVREEEIVKSVFGSPLKHSPDFHGPLKRRSCTDILCLFLFLAFIGGWIFVATYAYRHGDPQKLIYPTDSRGLRCGVDEEVKDKRYLFFFDLTECAKPAVLATGCPTPQVCVKECPKEDFAASYYLATNRDLQGLKNKLICKYDVDVSRITSFAQVKQHVDNKECAAWYMNSSSLAGRCIPSFFIKAGQEMVELTINGQRYDKDNIQSSVIKEATLELVKAQEVGEMLLQDLAGSWHVILLGLLEAMLLCLVYIVIMRFLAEPMIWLSLIGSMILMSFCIYFCYDRYTYLSAVPNTSLPDPTLGDIFTGNFQAYLAVKDTWLVLGIIAAVVLVIVLLITLFLRNRLRIAIALIREASKAVGSTMSSLFFPVVPWLLQILVLSFGLSVMVYLASTGTPVNRVKGMDLDKSCQCQNPKLYHNQFNCEKESFKRDCHDANSGGECLTASCAFHSYGKDAIITWFHTYNIVGLFWGLFFVSAFGEMVLAGTFATWYWTFKKENVPFYTVTSAFFRTIRYHMGTLAFGSLIITICRIIRMILEWIDHKLKKYPNNGFARGILCCCKCCFWCLEKFLRFLNRNAYIMCAVHGKNFCNSARDAFFLLMRNVVRVVVLDKVTDFLLFLGKLLIVSAMFAQWFCIMSGKLPFAIEHIPTLNYYMVPVFVITIGSYFIASVFFNVYAIAVDTLFLCFLEDSERNDGTAEKPYFMSAKLLRILSKKNKLDKLD